MATVELRQVWKKYGDVEAVRELSLTCHDGEFLCLLGPSGCGKSSTMRMVAGLEAITAGDILMDGRSVKGIPPRERDIAMVFENYALYPHMNVYDNIAVPLRTRRLPRDEVDRRIHEVAEILSIVPLLRRRIRNLSGGQKQRVGIGRAIVREPRLFIMDEPISHLEARLRADMRTELKRLHRRLGVTTLYVTHDQLEAVALADRIAVLHLGELQQVGPPGELFDQPANEFVASFIGSPPMNMLEFSSVSLEGDDLLLAGTGPAIRIPGLAARLPERLAHGPHKLGVRPIDIELRPPDGEATIRGEVLIRERLGDHDRFLIACSGESLVVEAPPDARGSEGDAIGLLLPPSRVHLHAELRRIQKQMGTTAIYATPDYAEAMAMADRLAVIHEGGAVQVGTPLEVYFHPANEFVARFMGDPPMNFFDCEIVSGPAGPAIRLAGQVFAPGAVAAQTLGRLPGGPVRLGLRPTDIAIARSGEPLGSAVLSAEVLVVEPSERAIVATLSIGETEFKLKTFDGGGVRPGDRLDVQLDSTRMHVFDSATGLTLGDTAPIAGAGDGDGIGAR